MAPSFEDLVAFVSTVQEHVSHPSAEFRDLLHTRSPVHPISFFGDPRSATLATIGINPSRAEFASNRNWPSDLTAEQLTRRILSCFTGALCPPHPWFGRWARALARIGVSYEAEAVHLDLSPRATAPLGGMTQDQQKMFERMIDADSPLFFRALEMFPNLQVLLAAGVISKLKARLRGRVSGAQVPRARHDARHAGPFRRRPGGPGNVGTFFCGSGPSDRKKPGLLEMRVKEHAAFILAWRRKT